MASVIVPGKNLTPQLLQNMNGSNGQQPSCIILWVIVSGCTAAVTNTAGLLALRFCLGLIEAPFFPGAVYFLSCWYTKRELGVRMALLICGLLLSNAFVGLILTPT
jgi:MFS family permease